MTTSISQAMIEAYSNTDFRVEDTVSFVLKVGIQSDDLMSLYKETGNNCSAYITAWNPYSQEQSLEENKACQAALLKQLSGANFRFFAGVGQDPLGQWPGEPSVLVLGMDKNQGISVGKKYKQNAIVWMGADAIPELILLR
jgi:hypothetical protein